MKELVECVTQPRLVVIEELKAKKNSKASHVSLQEVLEKHAKKPKFSEPINFHVLSSMHLSVPMEAQISLLDAKPKRTLPSPPNSSIRKHVSTFDVPFSANAALGEYSSLHSFFCFVFLWPLRLSLLSGTAVVFAQTAIGSGPPQIFTSRSFVYRRPF